MSDKNCGSLGPFDLERSTDDFGPKASCTGVKMMANQLGLRSQKCLTKIAAVLEAETSGGPLTSRGQRMILGQRPHVLGSK